jgi:drug/metabolite transporter (DMT)-like permease
MRRLLALRLAALLLLQQLQIRAAFHVRLQQKLGLSPPQLALRKPCSVPQLMVMSNNAGDEGVTAHSNTPQISRVALLSNLCLLTAVPASKVIVHTLDRKLEAIPGLPASSLLINGASMISLAMLSAARAFVHTKKFHDLRVALIGEPKEETTTAIVAAESLSTRLAGLELAAWLCAATVLQVMSIISGAAPITAASMAYLSILIVPLYEKLVMKTETSRALIAAAPLSLLGLYLLSLTRVSGHGFKSLVSFVLCLLVPVCYSAHDIRLSVLGKKLHALRLAQARQFWYVVILAVCTIGVTPSLSNSISVWRTFFSTASKLQWLQSAALLCCIGTVKAVSQYIHTSAHPKIGASRAQIVYATAPVWTTVLTTSSSGSLKSSIGVACILAALVITALPRSIVERVIQQWQQYWQQRKNSKQ